MSPSWISVMVLSKFSPLLVILILAAMTGIMPSGIGSGLKSRSSAVLLFPVIIRRIVRPFSVSVTKLKKQRSTFPARLRQSFPYHILALRMEHRSTSKPRLPVQNSRISPAICSIVARFRLRKLSRMPNYLSPTLTISS